MTTLERILREVQELSAEDQELLLAHLAHHLGERAGPIEEEAFIAALDAEAARAREQPGSLLDWEAAEREIFGDIASA